MKNNLWRKIPEILQAKGLEVIYTFGKEMRLTPVFTALF